MLYMRQTASVHMTRMHLFGDVAGMVYINYYIQELAPSFGGPAIVLLDTCYLAFLLCS